MYVLKAQWIQNKQWKMLHDIQGIFLSTSIEIYFLLETHETHSRFTLNI